MAQNLVVMIPLAGLSVVGWFLLSRRKRKQLLYKLGAFVEEIEILPPVPPPPPQAPPVLTGLTFVVKDIFDIGGRVTGFGNPDWKKTHTAAESTSYVIDQLVNNGAKLVGVTHMDELAYSIMGVNRAYGTPQNPAAPDNVPGGSSSGSAVAVAAGFVDFAIGTDTGGSVRVPAAFCGVLGFRPSHGAVSDNGVIPMAPSFDTVGCFARNGLILKAVVHTLLDQPYSPLRPPRKILIADDLFDLFSGPKRLLLDIFLQSTEKILGGVMQRVNIGNYLADKLPSIIAFLPPNIADSSPSEKGIITLKAIREAFRVLQGYQFHEAHSHWLSTARPKLGADIAARVAFASSCTKEQADLVQRLREEMRIAMNLLLKEETLLALPTVAGLPPKLKARPEEIEEFRAKSFLLLSLAGMSGCPQLTMPAGTTPGEGLPLAISLMARYGADSLLLDACTGYEGSLLEEASALAERERQRGVGAGGGASSRTTQQEAAERAKERGNEAYKEKRYDVAVEEYSEAIRLDNRNATYYSNRAMAQLQLCNFQEAEQDCTTALEVDKRNVKAMLRRGTAREFMGFYNEAVQDFEHALVYEPNNRTAMEAVNRIRGIGFFN